MESLIKDTESHPEDKNTQKHCYETSYLTWSDDVIASGCEMEG